jgi:hypothetical protein
VQVATQCEITRPISLERQLTIPRPQFGLAGCGRRLDNGAYRDGDNQAAPHRVRHPAINASTNDLLFCAELGVVIRAAVALLVLLPIASIRRQTVAVDQAGVDWVLNPHSAATSLTAHQQRVYLLTQINARWAITHPPDWFRPLGPTVHTDNAADRLTPLAL